MLINCPRCGFQQPKDKYCAHCGVDMETFKPATPSVWKKLASNPLLQLSVLIIVASGVGLSLYKKGEQNFERRTAQSRTPVQINSTSSTYSSSTETANLAETPTTDQASNTPEENNPAGGVVNAYKVESPSAAATTETTPTPAPDAKDTRSLTKNTASHLIVYYVEVQRPSLQRIFAASRATGQFMTFNDYSAGIAPRFKNFLNSPQSKILHKEDRPLENTKTLQWSYGLKDRQNPSSEIGLATFFELSELDRNNLRGNIEIQRTWKELNPSGTLEVQRKSFPAIFEIGGDVGFFISGVLPTQSNLENDDELTSIDVFKILHSPHFRAGESDLVIFVEFSRSN